TGYEEWSGDVKIENFLSDTSRLVIAHQRVDQNDVPRTHKTVFAVPFEGTSIGSDLARDYDQDRSLSYAQLHLDDVAGFIDSARISLSWHQQDEILRRTKSSGSRQKQGFEVGTLGLLANARSETASGEWVYGFELYRDHVDSFLNKFDEQDAADDIQGPVADDAIYDLFGAYAQDEWSVSDELTLTAGARASLVRVSSDDVLDPETNTRRSIDENWSALTGSLRFRYELESDECELFGGISQGFRAPNLSDLTRLDSARTDEFEVPSPDLDPERYLSYELGIKARADDLSAEASLFYTDIQDQIVRFPTGATNADGDTIISKDNVGDGEVYGIELGSSWRVNSEWTLFGNATWIEGEVETFPTSAPVIVSETISRQMPLTMQAGLRWDDPGNHGWAELLVLHADDADELSSRDASDSSRIPPGGTPGYTVVDIMTGWPLHDDIELSAGVTNISDEDYRVHGSGSNRPGRAFVIGLRATF
ncbi:MAG: hemoglobin/transferrin/lactoferrin receptor protein, partial [Planctomycetota bacterium]